ncbi:AAA family ATPase [Chryseobacterium sp.]|uniref:AAA family ATPase n=1 Tax=Chryseobacterium sp. TaxID=1871047 RepID=UPI0028A26682|nr:AAA family ATPase [Chryseobacterium sp.]
MRLTAIYIKQHYLFSPSQIINLGGKYFYEIIERREENEYDLKRYENPNFIDNFWGDDISLVSAVVGENGSGKTSLLKQMTSYGNWYTFNFFIWEDDDALFFTKIYHASFSKIKPKFFFNSKELLDKSEILESTQSIYYSPVLSYEYSRYGSSYRTRFYNTSRATVYLTLDTLLAKNNLNLSNFISENFKRELIFCESFKNFSVKYHFLDYNVDFSTTKDKLDNLKLNENIKLSETELRYIRDFQDIESELKIGPYTYINYNYLLPYHFYIEFILYLKYYFEEHINKILATESLDGNLDKVLETFFKTKKPSRNKNIRERFDNIKKLYYLIVEQTSYDLFNYTFSRKDAIDIIDLQEKIAFSVESKDNLISGAKFFTPNPTNVLSSGEKSLLNLFSNIYSTFSNSYVRYADEKMDVNNQFTNYNQKIERIILFLDEADLGFHPQWKKKYIKIITDIFPEMFKEINGFKSVQIIFTTHDSLTLSDIPNSNIVYLKKDGNKTKFLSEYEKPEKSFGANITDLLANSFFIEDGLIGDFAKDKIETVIQYLNNSERGSRMNKITALKIIDIIDEPILKNKLRDMYFEKFPEEYDLEKEKEEIRKRAIELGIIKE